MEKEKNETKQPKKSYVLPMGEGYRAEREVVEHIDLDFEALREHVRQKPRIVETEQDIGRGIYL